LRGGVTTIACNAVTVALDGIVQSPQEECDDGPDNGKGNCLQDCTIDMIQ
jgi:hypothetical protein